MPRVEVLDLRGYICPASLLLSLKKINGLREELAAGGVVLRILTANRESVPTISGAAQSMGYAVTVECEAEYYVLRVERASEKEPR